MLQSLQQRLRHRNRRSTDGGLTSSTRAVIAWAVTQDGSGLTSGMRSVDACATTAGSFSSVRTSCALGERIFANGRGSQAANEHRVGGERSRCAVSVTVSEARATMLVMPHDWFADLTGFREEGYDLTRSRLRVEVNELVSTVNDKRYRIGELSLPTLAELRASAPTFPGDSGAPSDASPG